MATLNTLLLMLILQELHMQPVQSATGGRTDFFYIFQTTLATTNSSVSMENLNIPRLASTLCFSKPTDLTRQH